MILAELQFHDYIAMWPIILFLLQAIILPVFSQYISMKMREIVIKELTVFNDRLDKVRQEDIKAIHHEISGLQTIIEQHIVNLKSSITTEIDSKLKIIKLEIKEEIRIEFLDKKNA